jgi:hypothetical protein
MRLLEQAVRAELHEFGHKRMFIHTATACISDLEQVEVR